MRQRGLKYHSVWCVPRLTWQVLLGSVLILVHLTNGAVKLIIMRTGRVQSLHDEDSRRGRKGGIEGGGLDLYIYICSMY